ncbi:MAG: sulfotransferase domain-containing protein [Acidimicrobiia bacterium]
MLPNFLIVGSMKCGTSALFRGVVSHDDVFGAKGKELHYFDRNYEKGPEWYMAHFVDHGGATAVGEGTPYLSGSPSMQLIVNDLPHAKMVAIVRQPVDRAYSHYWHNRRRGREDRPFVEAFTTDAESPEAIGPWMNYWRLGTYAKYLRNLADGIGAEKLLVLLSEDLRDDRPATLASVWRHIGVDPERGRLEVPERSGWKKAYRASKHLVKGHSDDRSYPPLDPATRNDLIATYREDILDLQDFAGRDLSSWLAPA